MLMLASVKCIGINSVLCSRKTSRLMWLDRAAQRLSRMKRVRDCLEVRFCVFSSQLSLLELLFQEIKESEQFWAMQLKSLPFYPEPLFPSIPREIMMTDPVQRDVPGHVPAPALLPRTERPIVTTRAQGIPGILPRREKERAANLTTTRSLRILLPRSLLQKLQIDLVMNLFNSTLRTHPNLKFGQPHLSIRLVSIFTVIF